MNDSGYGNLANVRAVTCSRVLGGSSSNISVLNGTIAVVQAPFMSVLNAARTNATASLARRSNTWLAPLFHSLVATYPSHTTAAVVANKPNTPTSTGHGIVSV